MNYLLDTNVVSEWTKPVPDARVARWLDEADEDRIFLSVISIAELRRGIERLDAGTRRSRLDAWLSGPLVLRFDGRILEIDKETAELWGHLMARGQSLGKSPATMDAFIAATAKRHALTLVTRNVRDFESLDVAIFNPWVPS